MPVVTSESRPPLVAQPRILIVDDEPELIELMRDLVVRRMDCSVVLASSIREARHALATGPVDVLVTDVHLPDGDGTSLLQPLRLRQPQAGAIVITGSPSLDGAINAIRGGAIDFVQKPFSHEQIVERISRAVEQQIALAKRERRIDRLREAVRRLNESRKTISRKVDLLCNDLVGAYGELSRQMDVVRGQEDFRKHIAGAGDLEQLLCHSMDWLLRKIGYSNVAVYLAADDGAFQLGAYMKYTVAGESRVTDAVRRVIVPMTVREGVMRVAGPDLADRMSPPELEPFREHSFLAASCTYLGESLASLVFFRDTRIAFSDDDAETLKSISAIFAVRLAAMVHEEAEEGQTPFDDADFNGGTSDADPKKKPGRKPDPADWWKRGEQPPF